MAEHPDARTDSIRYALREAIGEHLERCGNTVAIDGIPDEIVASEFLSALHDRGFTVVRELTPFHDASVCRRCDVSKYFHDDIPGVGLVCPMGLPRFASMVQEKDPRE